MAKTKKTYRTKHQKKVPVLSAKDSTDVRVEKVDKLFNDVFLNDASIKFVLEGRIHVVKNHKDEDLVLINLPKEKLGWTEVNNSECEITVHDCRERHNKDQKKLVQKCATTQILGENEKTVKRKLDNKMKL